MLGHDPLRGISEFDAMRDALRRAVAPKPPTRRRPIGERKGRGRKRQS